MNIIQAQAAATSLGLDRLDAQLLLLHLLGKPQTERAWLLAHGEFELPEGATQSWLALARRRAAGEPLAYITGSKDFFGLTLQVDARVLVPRPDTETLVEWALEVLAPHPQGRVIDLGCGSGAIALALKANLPGLDVGAIDASPDALAVALANAQHLRLDVHFSLGNWLEQTEGRLHAIISNPPYIAEDDPHMAALAHEPKRALTSGKDGLDDLRDIVRQAPDHLLPGGWLLLEHGYDQASAVRHLLTQAGFTQVQSRKDLAGIERCSGGQLPTMK
jgi:release factor glutamine methyltransferase